jgi:hypothetical protein
VAVSFSRPIAVNHATGALTYDASSPAAGALASGFYYFTNPTVTVGTSATLGVGTARLTPFVVPSSVTLSRVGAEVVTAGDAGSKYRLGLYADSGGLPGELVADFGTINGDSNTVQEITISQALSPGLYWMCGVVQVVTTTQPTMRTCPAAPFAAAVPISATIPGAAHSGTTGVSAGNSVTGALPSSLSSFTPGLTQPRFLVKVA